MTYKAKVAVCSEIRTEHPTQSEHRVEFKLNLVIRKETSRLLKVNVIKKRIGASPVGWYKDVSVCS